MTQAASRILKQNACVLERVSGMSPDGEEQIAYVLLKQEKLAAFRKALTERDCDLNEFGLVVAHGDPSLSELEEAIVALLTKAA